MNSKIVVKFLFPFWPIKVFKSITGICLLAALLGLSILLNLLKIRIGSGVTISFAWLPGIIIGWYFGPIIGLFMGSLIDTINWLAFGGVWFWLYAIQEPILGFIVGLISSSYAIIKTTKYHFQISVTINQIMFLLFLSISILLVFLYTSPNNPFFVAINGQTNATADIIKKTQKYLRWIILGVLLLLLIIVESIIIYKYRQWKQNPQINLENFETFLFLSVITLTSTLIFSFLLGPISAIEYYKFLNNTTNVPNLINYGVMYYLLPRVIKECFKTPIYMLVLTALVCSLNPVVKGIKNKLDSSYHCDENSQT